MLCYHKVFLIHRNLKPGDFTQTKLAFSLVFPVKLLQLLYDIQHFQHSHSCKLFHLFENITGTRASSYGKCLCVSALSHRS